MNASEKIQAAIDKLEGLREQAFPPAWSAFHTGVSGGDHSFVLDGEGEVILSVTANDGIDEELREPTADLIVTLHRTIDAQLAILYRGISDAAPEREVAELLADAILGNEA